MIIPFKQYITEAKNIHQIHLEQNAFLGIGALRTAILTVQDLRAKLKGHSQGKSVDVSMKWDGAPAVFAGINPETGKFFVSTKGLFNKDPKLVQSKEDLSHYSGDLAAKMATAYEELSKLGIKGILQGDILFTKSDLKKKKIDGVSYYIFRPNTIVYAVPVDSPLGKEISSAKIGVVFHTVYTGKTLATLSASYNPKISSLKKNKNAWVIDAFMHDYSGTLNFTDKEDSWVSSILSEIGKTFRQVSAKTYAGLEERQLDMKMEQYVNAQVREGKIAVSDALFVEGFKTFYMRWYSKNKIDKVKSDAAKEKHTAVRDEHFEYIDANRKQIAAMAHMYNLLYDIKMLFVRKFEEIGARVSHFVETGKGYKCTAPEGFCAIRDGQIIKLVDRLEFSQNNFNIAKKWS